MGKLSVVVGGQYGSEAKGHVTAWLSRSANNNGPIREREVSVVRVGGPNAGHTVYGSCPSDCIDHRGAIDHPWRLRHLPVATISNQLARLYLAAGSEVDPTVLFSEISAVKDAGYLVGGRLMVDATATLLQQHHIDDEVNSDLVQRLGSTAKGIGAARADRVWRSANTFGQWADDNISGSDVTYGNTEHALRLDLEAGNHVIIEGTQGYGLGLHTEAYPQVTSGDCRAIDFMAQAGISPWDQSVTELDVWVVARTKSIRVAGNSGPMHGETTWEALGLPEEKTTVTQKVRRVAQFDAELVRDAVLANGGGWSTRTGSTNPTVNLALTMVDYEIPEVKGMTNVGQMDGPVYSQFLNLIYRVESQVGAKVGLAGTGPNTMIDLRDPR